MDHYTVDRLIGSGSFANVYLLHSKAQPSAKVEHMRIVLMFKK